MQPRIKLWTLPIFLPFATVRRTSTVSAEFDCFNFITLSANLCNTLSPVHTSDNVSETGDIVAETGNIVFLATMSPVLATMSNEISSLRQCRNKLNTFNLLWLCRTHEQQIAVECPFTYLPRCHSSRSIDSCNFLSSIALIPLVSWWTFPSILMWFAGGEGLAAPPQRGS